MNPVRSSVDKAIKQSSLGESVSRLSMQAKKSLSKTSNGVNKHTSELDRIAKMLVRRDFELSQIRNKQEGQIRELDRIAKMLVRRDFELLQTSEVMRLLDEAKAKDEALLESIGEGMVAIGKDEKVLIMNQSAEKMLGWRIQDVIGKKWFEILALEDEKGNEMLPEQHPIQLALSSGKKTTATTYHFVRKDKTKFPVAITATPIILNGEIGGAIMVFRDITIEKEIDRAKSEFVSLASHQLRTPLTTIKWQAEALLAEDFGKISKKQKECLEGLYQANQRMIELVRALLNVSRIELGTLVVESEPTNLREIADSVLGELLPEIKNKKLNMKKSYDKNLAIINADTKLIRIVFQNLLSNAVKYTPEKGKVSLIIKKQKPDILIKVTDTGYGIPKAQQLKICTKLFRADNVRRKDPNGTGLGLYIVKSIVEKSGGKIWFESVEDKGTTFYVTIPLEGMKERGKRGIGLVHPVRGYKGRKKL